MKKIILFFCVSAFCICTFAQSILTQTYYLNEFNGISANDNNGVWTTNSTMPGAVSQADGSLIVDLANTSDYGTLCLALNTPLNLTEDSKISIEWKFENAVFTNTVTNPEPAIAIYLADAGSYENGHSKATNPSLRTPPEQWAIGICDPLHYNSNGSTDDQPSFVCNRANVKYIKIAYLQTNLGKILSGTLKISKLEIGKRPLINNAKATKSLLESHSYVNDFSDIHDGTHQVFADKYILPNADGKLDLWTGASGLGEQVRMFIDKLAKPINLSEAANRVFYLKGHATLVKSSNPVNTDGQTVGIHFFTKPTNEGLGIYMNMPNDKKMRLKGTVFTVLNNSEFEITVDLNNQDNWQDGASGKGANFDWSKIGAWGLYTRGGISADAHIYIDEVRIGAERIPLDLALNAYTPATNNLTVSTMPAAATIASTSVILTNAENNAPLAISNFSNTNGIWNLSAPFESGKFYTLSVADPVFYLPNPLTFSNNGEQTAVDVHLIMADDSSIKLKLSRLIDLTAENFTLYNTGNNSPITVSSIQTKSGEEYTLAANLTTATNYSLTIAKDGYYFGAPLTVNKNENAGETTPINREALVKRHTVHLNKLSDNELPQVGNGKIAFSIDATGLQTFYGNTMSDWGWHTVPCPSELYAGYATPHEALRLKQYNYNGRQLGLRTTSSGQTELYNWMRENPHRFNLGRLRFLLTKQNGTQIANTDVQNIDQSVDLWRGIVISNYTIEGIPVSVETCVEPASGALAVRVTSSLINQGRLKIEWAFPYGNHGNSGADWNNPTKHTSTRTNENNTLKIARTMDDVQYRAQLHYETTATIAEPAAHTFVVTPDNQSNTFAFTVCYSPEIEENVPAVAAAFASSENSWETFWRSGGAIDLSESADPRWHELERRIVLSQYLLAVNNAGCSLPPQESGYFSNTGSWNGKFHLEMHWWHQAHYALWGRFSLFEPSLQYYRNALPKAKVLAQSQGFQGARFVKMSGPDNEDAPSGTGPLIIWQQPHPIFYAELEYRLNPTREVLEKWQEVIQETANFMADFACYNAATDRYVLGPPVATVPENTDYATSKNPTFELAYWHTGLCWAQIWRERLGLERNTNWDLIMQKLSQPSVQNGLYLQQEGMTNTYDGMNWEHPSLIGVGGMLPFDRADHATVRRTVAKVWEVWQWDRCWGWDFPMMAMAAARNGQQSTAIDALLHSSTKNAMNAVGLSLGGPYPYFPANGGLLYAVALMAAGWDDAPDTPAPGFPNDGVSWKVRYEGLTKAPENFELNIPQSLENISENNGIIVFPNPVTNGQLTITNGQLNGSATVEIYDIFGKRIVNRQFSSDNSRNSSIDVSSLQNGLYLVKIEIDKEVVAQKVLIKKQ